LEEAMKFEIKSRWNDAVIWSGDAESILLAVKAALASGANLYEAYLYGANLSGANLSRANLSGATMPDGRAWELYRLDPLAGICDEPEARKRAIAAWGHHQWTNCPMHAAHGYGKVGDAPEDKRVAVAVFVAVFDAELLPRPAQEDDRVVLP
jgi:hypothetical protein